MTDKQTSKYIIVYEVMGGDWYYMIYRNGFFGLRFFERWNTAETAIVRIMELNI